MNESSFVAEREPDWQRLYALTSQAETSLSQLSGSQFFEFIGLYKRVSRDLARVQTESTNRELIAFLNDLVGRAYGQLYYAPRKRLGEMIGGFFVRAAQTVRRERVFVFASLGLFFGSCIIGYLIMSFRPDLQNRIVPPGFEAVVQHWKSGVHEERSVSESAQMVGFYAQNNPFVSILVVSLAAATFGVQTVMMMWGNGALLGALAFECQQSGTLGFLVSSILPHGASELTGIIIAGAAGMRLGWSMIAPGQRTRGASILAAGPSVLILMLLALLQMFLAAPVEAFFSFNPGVPQTVKVVFGAVVLSAWLLFFVGYGKIGETKRG